MSFKSALSALFSLLVFAGAGTAIAKPLCAGCQSGDSCTINGQAHTCGFSGGSRCIIIGDLSAEEADKSCDCHYKVSDDCAKTNGSKSPVKSAAVKAKTKAIAPAQTRAVAPTGR